MRIALEIMIAVVTVVAVLAVVALIALGSEAWFLPSVVVWLVVCASLLTKPEVSRRNPVDHRR